MFMKFFALIFAGAFFCSALHADGEEYRAARLDFSSSPEKASVLVNGKVRGKTPITLYDLTPGLHHISYSLDGYEPVDFFVAVESGARISKFFELNPKKGILLVTTEPEGCTLSLNGVSLGETPRLVTSLNAKDKYKLKLEKTGYISRMVEVKFPDFAPVVKHEKLITNSGAVTINTTPSGASVIVNGISRGVTPMTLDKIAKGKVTVSLSLEGYRPVERELSLLPGSTQTLDVELEGLPGSLRVTSIPETARIYVDGEMMGRGDVTVAKIKPGSHTIRAELDGYRTESRTIEIPNGERVVEELRLENIMGRLEIITAPANAKIFLNGKSYGTTKPRKSNSNISSVFTVGNLKEGQYTLVVKSDGYTEVTRRITIKPSSSTQEKVALKKLFIPDVEVETTTGVYKGILVSNTPDALIVEVKAGVTRSFRKADIRKFTFLDAK
jgi:hypothetical protein